MDTMLHHESHGHGFPVVLGGSYLWGAEMWQPQIDALRSSHRVIVPLLPGHDNDSPLPADCTTPAALAVRVGRLLDALRIEQCAVAGLSVGGMWAAELALQQPSRVRSLLLLDTFLGAEPAPAREQYLAMLSAIEQAGHIPAALIAQIVPLFFRAGIDPEDPLRRAFAERLAHWPTARIPALVALGRLIFNRPERLQAVAGLDKQRTLVACGEEDGPRPPAEVQRMAQVIGCRLQLIPCAGHISSRENPQAVTTLLQAWLSRLH
jgi:pimeloyl-ACP methyl ester carboxylesterase